MLYNAMLLTEVMNRKKISTKFDEIFALQAFNKNQNKFTKVAIKQEKRA